MSLDSEWSSDGWGAIMASIRDGNFVEDYRFIVPLRGNKPIPDEVRSYLANRLDGTIKRGRGQPHKSSRNLSGIEQLKSTFHAATGFSGEVHSALSYLFRLHTRARRCGIKCSLDDATKRAAKKHNMAAASLAGQLKRAKRANFISE